MSVNFTEDTMYTYKYYFFIGRCIKPFGDVPMLYCDKSIWMVCQHGEDHEGTGTPRHQHYGIHGRQETLGNQPRPFHHQSLEI